MEAHFPRMPSYGKKRKVVPPVRDAKRVMLSQHVLLQIPATTDAELSERRSEATFDRVGRNPQMSAYLLVCPIARGQHRHREFGSCEVVCHGLFGNRIVNAPPPRREPVRDVDNALEIFRPILLDDRFEHATQKPVMLAKRLYQAIGASERPCGEQMRTGRIRLPEAHVVHDRHQVKVDLGYGIVARHHEKRGLYQA